MALDHGECVEDGEGVFSLEDLVAWELPRDDLGEDVALVIRHRTPQVVVYSPLFGTLSRSQICTQIEILRTVPPRYM